MRSCRAQTHSPACTCWARRMHGSAQAHRVCASALDMAVRPAHQARSTRLSGGGCAAAGAHALPPGVAAPCCIVQREGVLATPVRGAPCAGQHLVAPLLCVTSHRVQDGFKRVAEEQVCKAHLRGAPSLGLLAPGAAQARRAAAADIVAHNAHTAAMCTVWCAPWCSSQPHLLRGPARQVHDRGPMGPAVCPAQAQLGSRRVPPGWSVGYASCRDAEAGACLEVARVLGACRGHHVALPVLLGLRAQAPP